MRLVFDVRCRKNYCDRFCTLKTNMDYTGSPQNERRLLLEIIPSQVLDVRDPNLGVLFVTFSGGQVGDLYLGDQKVTAGRSWRLVLFIFIWVV